MSKRVVEFPAGPADEDLCKKKKKSHFIWLTRYSFLFCQISISSKDASEDLNQYGIQSASAWGYICLWFMEGGGSQIILYPSF